MTDNLMTQNFNNDLMRQMQQQLAPLAAQQGNGNQQGTAGLGSLQNGLGNLNANALMSAFQAAPQGQNSQQGLFDVQRAENILAAAIAAANNNAQNQSSGQAQQTQQPQQQQLQPNAFAGLQGLEQLQNLNNPLQQAAAAVNQQPNGFPDLRRQSLGGLQGLQQQLANLQQQLGQGGQQQNPQQQGQQQQQTQQQQVPQQSPTAFPAAWMQQNLNSGGFNPAALSLTGALGGDANNFQPDAFGTPVPAPNGQHPLGGVGSPGGLPQFQQQPPIPHQQPAPKRRSSSLSSGSMSPIGKQKTTVNNVGNTNFSSMFTPNIAVSNVNERPAKVKVKRTEKKKRAKTFPEKLMQSMMEYADEEAVAWLPDGKSFVIVNPDLFCDDVLNKVFKESKYASFVRKLHRWGFVRLTSGTGTDCFHHPQFQRNRKEMAGKITCAPRGDKDKIDRPSSERNSKPPSLAGVEKFIRAKVVAAAASAAATAEESLLLKAEGDLSGDNHSRTDDVI
jgi:hypothetical protein